MATPMTRDAIEAWGMDEKGCDRWDYLPTGESNALRSTAISIRQLARLGKGSGVNFSDLRGRDRSEVLVSHGVKCS